MGIPFFYHNYMILILILSSHLKGTSVNTFASLRVEYTPTQDFLVNGWDNGYAMYTAKNIAMNNGLTLSISNSGCPVGTIPSSFFFYSFNPHT